MKYDWSTSKTYWEARQFNSQTMETWKNVIKQYAPAKVRPRVLDLGSGVGRFSVLLAETLDSKVIGVEPSDAMRQKGIEVNTYSNVEYLTGAGESIPAKDAEFDMAWLSMIYHHLSSQAACARELRRVLKKEGRLIIRNTFKDRLDPIPMYRYFPQARLIDERRLPDSSDVRKLFCQLDFTFVELRPIRQMIDISWAAHLERLRKRGCSSLELISDSDFDSGIKQIEQDLASHRIYGEVNEMIDVMVFERS